MQIRTSRVENHYSIDWCEGGLICTAHGGVKHGPRHPVVEDTRVGGHQSNSPISSPVVKKKDGSWRTCADYRALNAITVKDRFSILTVDE